MPRYMLLLHDDQAAFASLSPQQMQTIIEKYVAWGGSLRKRGLLGNSDKLADEPGRIVRRNNGAVRVTDGPYSETKEVLGGYYIVTAADYDGAIALTHDCPHLDYGTIEVRQIEEMPA
jgi:hypothetical protein